MKKKAAKKTKATHVVESDFIYVAGKHGPRPTAKLWNWHIRAVNGGVICYSNQGHARRIDARAAVRNFLDAVKAGTVEVKA